MYHSHLNTISSYLPLPFRNLRVRKEWIYWIQFPIVQLPVKITFRLLISLPTWWSNKSDAEAFLSTEQANRSGYSSFEGVCPHHEPWQNLTRTPSPTTKVTWPKTKYPIPFWCSARGYNHATSNPLLAFVSTLVFPIFQSYHPMPQVWSSISETLNTGRTELKTSTTINNKCWDENWYRWQRDPPLH